MFQRLVAPNMAAEGFASGEIVDNQVQHTRQSPRHFRGQKQHSNLLQMPKSAVSNTWLVGISTPAKST